MFHMRNDQDEKIKSGPQNKRSSEAGKFSKQNIEQVKADLRQKTERHKDAGDGDTCGLCGFEWAQLAL